MRRFQSFLAVVCAVATLALGAVALFGPARAADASPDTSQGASKDAAGDVPSGDARNGQRLYLAIGCFACHGRVGEGGAFNGPAPVLARTVLPYDSFKLQLREPWNDMPAYSESVMPDNEVADVFAYVRSLSGPKDAKAIAILKD